MKVNKALKRLAKIEVLMSNVAARYSPSAPHTREVLQDAKTAVARAKEAVEAFFRTAKNAAPVRKKAAVKKAAVKAPTAKTTKKRAPIKKAVKKTAAKPTAPAQYPTPPLGM